MKQGKFFAVGMLAAALAFGVISAGCDNGTSPDDGPAKVVTPTANPAAGVVVSDTEITLSTSTSGADIRYTLNGTDPTSTTGTEYSASSKPTFTANTTIKAIAYKDGMTDSDVLTAAYSIASFSNPPDTIADAATARAYFETIWNDIPEDWQTFFMTLWAEEGEGGEVPEDLDEIDDDHWEEMVESWPSYQQVWPALHEKMEANESPVAAPPVWPSNGTAIKTYVEGIWDDLTEDWQDYYLETIMYYYNHNHSESTITLPDDLDSVDDAVWAYMKTAWNGHDYQPEDAQHIFESLVLAINVLGMSPDTPSLDDFICAGLIRE
jgi:hypothetical protein